MVQSRNDTCKCGAPATVIFPGPRQVALCEPCWRERLREAEGLVKHALAQKRRGGRKTKKRRENEATDLGLGGPIYPHNGDHRACSK